MADKANYFSFSDKINFVSLELIAKTTCEKAVTAIKAEDVKNGLFQGFREKEKNIINTTCLIYLDIRDENKSMIGFNPSSYNVVYLEVGHGQYREEIFFQAKAADQQNAMSILRELVGILRKDGLVKTGTDYIDTSKYIELPAKFSTEEKKKAVGYESGYSPCNYPNNIGSGMGGGYGHGGYNQHNNRSGSHTTTYLSAAEKQKLTKPTLFKRRTVVPTEEALVLMRSKIQEIREGTYTQPDFKKTKIEDGKDWEAKDEDDYYADLAGNFCN